MADSKITALTSIGTSTDPSLDQMVIVDTSDGSMAATGTTKKVSLNQLLSSNPSATGGLTLSGALAAGSATITGDLTVDTSTLKVDSANDRVGIGTATPSQKLEVATTSSDTRVRINSTSVVCTEYFRSGTGLWLVGSDSTNAFKIARGSNFGGSADYFAIAAATADCTWYDGAGGTRMTLNSTGLGVGVTPAAGDGSGAFKAYGTGSLTANSRVGLDVRELVSGNQAGIILGAMTTENTAVIGSRTGSGNIAFQTYYAGSWGERMRIANDGNVGIGVTPSAWGLGSSGYRAFEIGAIGNSIFSATNDLNISSNAYYLAGWKYGASSYASQYSQGSGKHIWYTASSGTAGNAITFTQAMTLDASGNLLVGKTATGVGTVGNEIKAVGEFYSTQSASTNANFTYHVYSTGAAAYRFYVGLGGTVYATNTTISAISDARLKENVQDIDVGLDAILALKPRKFDWKNGKGKNIKGDRGFIAQEFETVFPNLVDEWKDPAPEGEAPYKSVRQDLIPVLVKAIQQLTDRVITLENK